MLNPSIILAGQGPDIMGSLSRGMQAGQQANQIRQQNDLAGLYRTQGAGILAGDQGALNALAGIDPMAAMGVQGQQLGMQSQRQDMQFSAERMQMMRTEAAQRASAALAQRSAEMTKEQAAQEAAKLKSGLSGAAFFFQKGDKAGYEGFLRQNGLDPAQYNFEAFPAHAATIEGVLDALEAFKPAVSDPLKGAPSGYMLVDPSNPAAGVKPLPGYSKDPADEYGRYVQEEGAAGRPAMTRLEFENAKKGKGTTLTVDPATGAVTYSQGGPNGTGEPTVGEAYNPNEISNVIRMIDEIAANPNLPRVVGPLEGGGGNNIDDLGIMQRGYYGGEGTALVERIGQLQSNAWLSARQMLKGGGAITDYESRKAEAAVARLSRAKSEGEFKQALKDLRDAITEGQAKLQGRGGSPAQSATAPVTGPQAPPRAEDASLPPSPPRRLRFNPATGDFE